MNRAILTNEYPPHVYGAAGVHVEYLTRELARLDDGAHQVTVYCFGDQDEQRGNLRVQGIAPGGALPAQQAAHRKLMDTLQRDLAMAGSVAEADVVHAHTWYTHLAGCLVKPLTGARLVLTTHSLEPHRPRKVEQLGTAYHASSWIEKTAYENADGQTGVLIDFEAVGNSDVEPRDPPQFARDLARAINDLMAAPERRRAMGRRGRTRVEQHFSWRTVAAQTLAFYEGLLQA